RQSLAQRAGSRVLGSGPQFSSVLNRETLLLAIAYARNGTFLPSGVGGAEVLLSSNRISSFLFACSALDKARRVLAVHSGIVGKRCSTVLMIPGCPPSSAKLRRSCPSAPGFSG